MLALDCVDLIRKIFKIECMLYLMGNNRLLWIILFILAVVALGYLFFVVSGMSGAVVDSVEKIAGLK